LFSSLQFDYTILSKRKIRWLIENKYINGWDDPRLCTIQGLLKRGVTPSCILQYVDKYYLSNNVSKSGTYSLMVSLNNTILDKLTIPRYTAINKDNLFTLSFDPPVDKITKSVQLHPKVKDCGTKYITVNNNIYLEGEDCKLLSIGDEVTLFNLGNVIIKEIKNNTIIAKPNFDGDYKTTKYKLSWLASDDAICISILEYDHILNTPKLVFNDDGTIDSSCINKDSYKKMLCYGDKSLVSLLNDTHIQFLRRGHHIISNFNEMEFIRLPDNKVNHLSSYAK
jgi:glutamyl-tRNA synthetase